MEFSQKKTNKKVKCCQTPFTNCTAWGNKIYDGVEIPDKWAKACIANTLAGEGAARMVTLCQCRDYDLQHRNHGIDTQKNIDAKQSCRFECYVSPRWK